MQAPIHDLQLEFQLYRGILGDLADSSSTVASCADVTEGFDFSRHRRLISVKDWMFFDF